MSTRQTFPKAFGRYTILEPFARGGMGDIFLAAAPDSDGQPVPCMIKKLLSEHVGAEYRQRFRDEASAWGRLIHPGVVRMLDAGEIDGDAFMAMELVDGYDLGVVWQRCFERRVAFPIECAVYIARQLADALAYIHSFTELRLVHRDISPSNVLLSFLGDVKLTDFGLALSSLKTQYTQPGTILGKASYLSPEQAAGKPLDHRSDIYSAGIILWELLAGRQLFMLAEQQSWDRAAIRPPSEHGLHVPPALDAIALRALAPRREDRYQSARDLRADLDAAAPDGACGAVLRRFLAALYPANSGETGDTGWIGIPPSVPPRAAEIRSPVTMASKTDSSRRSRRRVGLVFGVLVLAASATVALLVARPVGVRPSLEHGGVTATILDKPPMPGPPPPIPVAEIALPETSSPVVSPQSPRRAASRPSSKTRTPEVPQPPEDGLQLTVLAEEAFRVGRPIDAVRLAKKALGSGGGMRAQMVLAESYFDLKLFRDALDAYEIVLAKDPGNQAARMGHDLAAKELPERQR